MTKDTSGPVFPMPSIGTSIEGWLGLSIRDYFAAQAMQGELAGQYEGSNWYEPGKLAEQAYKMADAMIKERSK